MTARLALVAGLWSALAGALAPPPAPAVSYRPPTSAAVADPFRPPPQPWLPGNRGIEYATSAGAPIAAIGPGVVAFAGPVAGRLVLVVDHPDGLRSSYVGVGVVVVAPGQQVAGGQRVALAAGPFHLGVRRGDTYLDPASLWRGADGRGRAVLVGAPAAHHLGRSPPSSLQSPFGPPPGGSMTNTPRPAQRSPPAPPTVPGARPRHNRWRGEGRDGPRRDHEAVARGQGALRAPDPSVEPEDEALHLR